MTVAPPQVAWAMHCDVVVVIEYNYSGVEKRGRALSHRDQGSDSLSLWLCPLFSVQSRPGLSGCALWLTAACCPARMEGVFEGVFFVPVSRISLGCHSYRALQVGFCGSDSAHCNAEPAKGLWFKLS